MRAKCNVIQVAVVRRGEGWSKEEGQVKWG